MELVNLIKDRFDMLTQKAESLRVKIHRKEEVFIFSKHSYTQESLMREVSKVASFAEKFKSDIETWIEEGVEVTQDVDYLYRDKRFRFELLLADLEFEVESRQQTFYEAWIDPNSGFLGKIMDFLPTNLIAKRLGLPFLKKVEKLIPHLQR